jgi:hypothetical protein
MTPSFTLKVSTAARSSELCRGRRYGDGLPLSGALSAFVQLIVWRCTHMAMVS